MHDVGLAPDSNTPTLCTPMVRHVPVSYVPTRFNEHRMRPWTLLGHASIPGSDDQLHLLRRGDEFSIRIAGREGDLMNSRQHGSEEALASLACTALGTRRAPHVLVGGLGMGFTLAAILRALGPDARVTVAELVPEVVTWNHGPLGACAGEPLRDARVRVHVGDVSALVRQAGADVFDVVVLDVDNGPDGLTHRENDWLYAPAGLRAIARALRSGGVLGVWSVAPDDRFTARLRQVGYTVETHAVRARGSRGGRHTLWIARRP